MHASNSISLYIQEHLYIHIQTFRRVRLNNGKHVNIYIYIYKVHLYIHVRAFLHTHKGIHIIHKYENIHT